MSYSLEVIRRVQAEGSNIEERDPKPHSKEVPQRKSSTCDRINKVKTRPQE